MFNGSSSSKNLTEYREQNIFLISTYKNILERLDRIGNLGDHEKKSIVGYFRTFNWVNSKTYFDKKKFYDSLDISMPRLIQNIKDLIKELEKENEELTNHLKNLTTDKYSISNKIGDLMTSYIEKQQTFRQLISKLVPGIESTANDIFQLEKAEEKILEDFIYYYESLEDIVKAGKNNGEIFLALRALSIYLEKNILGNMENQDRDSETFFINELNGVTPKPNSNSIKFTENFFKSGRGHEIYQRIGELYKEMDGKSYQGLDSDVKKKIDKFLGDNLDKLFDRINVVKNKLKSQKSKGKLSDLEPTYFNIVSQLIQKLNTKGIEEFKIPAISTLDNLVVYEDENGNPFTFKEFVSDIIGGDSKNAEAVAKNTISYLQTVVSDQNKAYKKFLDLQAKYSATTKITKEGDDDSDDDTSEAFSGAEKIDSKDIERMFTEMGTQLASMCQSTIGIIESEDNWEEGKFSHQDEFNETKAAVILILKKYGKNLRKYSNKKSWDENTYKDTNETLKSLIKRWSGLSINKDLVKQICLESINLIQKIIK